MVFVCFACVRAEPASGSERVDVWEPVLWTCIIMCGEVCVCLYIYEVLVQTFNLPQPSECAKRRLTRCVLPPPSLPSSASQHSFSSLSLPPLFSLVFFHAPSHSPAPAPLFPHPMLRLILELLPWIPASSWRCLSTPAQEHLSWMCSTKHPNVPPGHVKGVLEGREGGTLVKVGVEAL